MCFIQTKCVRAFVVVVVVVVVEESVVTGVMYPEVGEIPYADFGRRVRGS